MKNKKVLIIILIICTILICGVIYFTLLRNQQEVQPAIKRDNIVLENKVDAVSYLMDLNLDTTHNSLSEDVTIEIKNNTDKEVSEICIRDMTPAILKYCKENYAPENNKKTTKINAITMIESNRELQTRDKQNHSAIYVSLENEDVLKPGDTKHIKISMQTDIPDREDRFGYVKKKEGTLYMLSFCYPYLADNKNGEWITDPYFDDGESRSYDLANYEVAFTAPESYKVMATGKSTTSQEKTTIKAESVRDFAIVACDFMDVDTFEVDGVTVNDYYLHSKKTDEYRKLTRLIAEDSLKLFTEKVGKYAYNELDIAPCIFGYSFGGMEFPGLVMTNATAFYEGKNIDVISLAEGLSHEIGHQWFYAAVGNREYAEGWIDESFTTLLERDIYGLTPSASDECVRKMDSMAVSIERKKKEREELIATAREDYKNIKLNVAPNEYSEEQSYGDAEYEGGYMFLQEVRKQMQDEKFSVFLKDYYKTFYMKTVTTKDVLEFIKKYDNSEKIQEIIKFYFK